MKNFLSLILALALTLSQIPPHAFADEFTFDFSADAHAGACKTVISKNEWKCRYFSISEDWRRDFGHAVSSFLSILRGIKPTPSYLM